MDDDRETLAAIEIHMQRITNRIGWLGRRIEETGVNREYRRIFKRERFRWTTELDELVLVQERLGQIRDELRVTTA